METITRLPDPAMLDSVLRDRAAVQKLKKALRQAVQELTPDKVALVRTDFHLAAARAASGGFNADFDAFLVKLGNDVPIGPNEPPLLKALVESIRKNGREGLVVHPGFEGRRKPTSDELAVFKSAAVKIRQVYHALAAGTWDTCIQNVFGKGKQKFVVEKFGLGIDSLDKIIASGGIFIDAMSKDRVWQCGGLGGETQISLPPSKLDGGADAIAATLAHEMTHALPNGLRTGDKFYRHHEEFPYLADDKKVNTADYYAELFDRITKKNGAGDVYTERLDTPDNVTPLLSQYKALASGKVNRAWATGINIHDTLQNWGSSGEKNESWGFTKTLFGGGKEITNARTREFIVNCSKVLGLTIHKRQALEKDRNEITRLDLSIVDNKLNILGGLLGQLEKVIVLPNDIKAFDEAKVDHVLRCALHTLNGSKDRPGLLSKDLDKDVKVIDQLAKWNSAPGWTTLIDDIRAAKLDQFA